MKAVLILVLVATASCVLAQEKEKTNVIYQSAGQVSAVAWGGPDKGLVVQGAAYSATITNESIQTLADGNRIAQTSSGTIARDSEGRTRQETVLPPIGNLSASNAPRLVFLQDPVAQTSYTLNLAEKTAQKMPGFPTLAAGAAGVSATTVTTMKFKEANGTAPQLSDAFPTALAGPPPTGMFIQRRVVSDELSQASTEDLGSQTMEGVLVNGVRTTHTIPAGQIGNDRPITVVTEVWTSPELKTVVYSKRNDPRMGEQTFRLSNIVRSEPEPSLFAVPADFKIVEEPHTILYRRNQ